MASRKHVKKTAIHRRHKHEMPVEERKKDGEWKDIPAEAADKGPENLDAFDDYTDPRPHNNYDDFDRIYPPSQDG